MTRFTGFLINVTDLEYTVSVRRTTDGIFSGTASGFMGLAFQSIAQTRALPFWQALVNNNLFTSPDISFWLTRSVNNQNAQAAEPGGVMTLGGSNTSLYTGNIEFLPMPSSTSPTYWLLQISSACGHCTIYSSNDSSPYLRTRYNCAGQKCTNCHR
jgi:cathepsin D